MTQEQKEDFKSGFEIAYQLEDFEGVCEWVMNFIKIDIESKLHQPTVISAVCEHDWYGIDQIHSKCRNCGRIERDD